MVKIRILIVEDHKLLRETFAFLLNSHAPFEVVAEADSGEKAIELAKELAPDVVVMDITLPGINGIEATVLLLQASPQSKVLGISIHTQPALIRTLLKKGARGYISKNTSIKEMAEAILEVSKGHQYLSKEISDILQIGEKELDDKKRRFNSLTRREIEIIAEIKKGLMSKEIAKLLGITEGTVEIHRHNILKKLNVNNAASLIEFFKDTSFKSY